MVQILKAVDATPSGCSFEFHSPEFLKRAVKLGLLASNSDLMDAYQLHGFLLRHNDGLKYDNWISGRNTLHKFCADELTPAEVQELRESVTGVIPFRRK